MKVARSMFEVVKSSKLEAVLSGRHEVQTVKGRVFINRNPQIFTQVLDYIGNELKRPKFRDIYEEDLFSMELDYWQISPKNPQEITPDGPPTNTAEKSVSANVVSP